MRNFIQKRSASLSMVVMILLFTVLLQEEISYTTTFGVLDSSLPAGARGLLPAAWLVLRAGLMLWVIVLWILGRKRSVFRAMIILNGVLTIGLLVNMLALGYVLFGLSFQAVLILLGDVFVMAITNILIFSIWYWIIDPPGVTENQRLEEAWDFLFPQRGDSLPYYESWQPRYTDYLYLAFTTSVAFSPTDTLPLTRRAKMMMLLQSAISIITLTVIAGSAINILAGNA